MASQTRSVFKLDWLSVKGHSEATDKDQSPRMKHKQRQTKCEHIESTEDKLLSNLVGPKSTVVTIEGIQCNSPLDSDS